MFWYTKEISFPQNNLWQESMLYGVDPKKTTSANIQKLRDVFASGYIEFAGFDYGKDFPTKFSALNRTESLWLSVIDLGGLMGKANDMTGDYAGVNTILKYIRETISQELTKQGLKDFMIFVKGGKLVVVSAEQWKNNLTKNHSIIDHAVEWLANPHSPEMERLKALPISVHGSLQRFGDMVEVDKASVKSYFMSKAAADYPVYKTIEALEKTTLQGNLYNNKDFKIPTVSEREVMIYQTEYLEKYGELSSFLGSNPAFTKKIVQQADLYKNVLTSATLEDLPSFFKQTGIDVQSSEASFLTTLVKKNTIDGISEPAQGEGDGQVRTFYTKEGITAWLLNHGLQDGNNVIVLDGDLGAVNGANQAYGNKLVTQSIYYGMYDSYMEAAAQYNKVHPQQPIELRISKFGGDEIKVVITQKGTPISMEDMHRISTEVFSYYDQALAHKTVTIYAVTTEPFAKELLAQEGKIFSGNTLTISLQDLPRYYTKAQIPGDIFYIANLSEDKKLHNALKELFENNMIDTQGKKSYAEFVNELDTRQALTVTAQFDFKKLSPSTMRTFIKEWPVAKATLSIRDDTTLHGIFKNSKDNNLMPVDDFQNTAEFKKLPNIDQQLILKQTQEGLLRIDKGPYGAWSGYLLRSSDGGSGILNLLHPQELPSQENIFKTLLYLQNLTKEVKVWAGNRNLLQTFQLPQSADAYLKQIDTCMKKYAQQPINTQSPALKEIVGEMRMLNQQLLLEKPEIVQQVIESLFAEKNLSRAGYEFLKIYGQKTLSVEQSGHREGFGRIQAFDIYVNIAQNGLLGADTVMVTPQNQMVTLDGTAHGPQYAHVSRLIQLYMEYQLKTFPNIDSGTLLKKASSFVDQYDASLGGVCGITTIQEQSLSLRGSCGKIYKYHVTTHTLVELRGGFTLRDWTPAPNAQEVTLGPGDRLLELSDAYFDGVASSEKKFVSIIETILKAQPDISSEKMTLLAKSLLVNQGINFSDDATLVCISPANASIEAKPFSLQPISATKTQLLSPEEILKELYPKKYSWFAEHPLEKSLLLLDKQLFFDVVQEKYPLEHVTELLSKQLSDIYTKLTPEKIIEALQQLPPEQQTAVYQKIQKTLTLQAGKELGFGAAGTVWMILLDSVWKKLGIDNSSLRMLMAMGTAHLTGQALQGVPQFFVQNSKELLPALQTLLKTQLPAMLQVKTLLQVKDFFVRSFESMGPGIVTAKLTELLAREFGVNEKTAQLLGFGGFFVPAISQPLLQKLSLYIAQKYPTSLLTRLGSGALSQRVGGLFAKFAKGSAVAFGLDTGFSLIYGGIRGNYQAALDTRVRELQNNSVYDSEKIAQLPSPLKEMTLGLFTAADVTSSLMPGITTAVRGNLFPDADKMRVVFTMTDIAQANDVSQVLDSILGGTFLGTCLTAGTTPAATALDTTQLQEILNAVPNMGNLLDNLKELVEHTPKDRNVYSGPIFKNVRPLEFGYVKDMSLDRIYSRAKLLLDALGKQGNTVVIRDAAKLKEYLLSSKVALTENETPTDISARYQELLIEAQYNHVLTTRQLDQQIVFSKKEYDALKDPSAKYVYGFSHPLNADGLPQPAFMEIYLRCVHQLSPQEKASVREWLATLQKRYAGNQKTVAYIQRLVTASAA